MRMFWQETKKPQILAVLIGASAFALVGLSCSLQERAVCNDKGNLRARCSLVCSAAICNPKDEIMNLCESSSPLFAINQHLSAFVTYLISLIQSLSTKALIRFLWRDVSD